MDCPKCHQKLENVTLNDVQVARCPQCGGSWYDKGELRVLKDRESHGDYAWIDLDLWKDVDKFRARRQQRYSCPRDGQPMTTVHYGDSSIAVDVCSTCEGLWLDKEEYEEIVRYLEEKADSASVGDYLADVRDEFVAVLTGKEGPLDFAKDVGKILYLLQLRFGVEHPTFAAAARNLPKV